MKIAILGYSGSGKSTLAKYLSTVLQIPVLYLDTVEFVTDWQKRDREEALSIVQAFMEQPAWVIDGNYNSFMQKERLMQADTIIFMNFSRCNCLFRVLKRYATYKNRSRESMSDGCIEKFDMEFLWWILYKGRTQQRRAHYKACEKQYAEKFVVLKNQRQLNRFMRSITSVNS